MTSHPHSQPDNATLGPWEISEARTVEGEYMVVGGEGHEFGLIASCTLRADAELIVRLRNQSGVQSDAAGTLDTTTVERCYQAVLQERCQRGTPWDLACTTIARKLLGLIGEAHRAPADVAQAGPSPLSSADRATYVDPDLDKAGNRRYWEQRARDDAALSSTNLGCEK